MHLEVTQDLNQKELYFAQKVLIPNKSRPRGFRNGDLAKLKHGSRSAVVMLGSAGCPLGKIALWKELAEDFKLEEGQRAKFTLEKCCKRDFLTWSNGLPNAQDRFQAILIAEASQAAEEAADASQKASQKANSLNQLTTQLLREVRDEKNAATAEREKASRARKRALYLGAVSGVSFFIISYVFEGILDKIALKEWINTFLGI
ncbi:hypothetical protein Q4544_02635 [Cognatishimia sp. 1_MG-2023]|uniref:hypothetical protein n=1 Tax=Cognatishimia sp. 1_MG-2023 TaxID=3062642 RepID=UPI0026E13069|nr:hypothetical protein [Cognatishimia sp. 1_MG-2023]MDO6725820.1 hypothetical protein [Cognatishimia sp. 1_MG-2023]